ncbi:hypothetical protein HHI36_015132 [Cryptolaemus montrouzieri]|uniref:Uncharacterized protein n=1 Tax=Cryptolaemus montrouzieri TaxID=559131 RepID=A0ABD2N5I7_9CUCU
MKPMNDIKRLQKELEHCQVNHDENKSFKSEYLRDLNSFLEKLDPNHDGVIMRTKKLKSSNSVEDLLNLQKEWKNLEKNLSTTKPEEVRKVDVLLENFETSIKAKRRSLAELMKKTNFESGQRRSDEIIRTSAKIFDLAEIQTTKPTKKLSREQVTPSKKYGTIEYTLQEITKISDRVEELGKNILAFEGTSEDLEYNFFRASLIDKKQILQNLAHRSSWNQVDVFKLEILEKIGFYEEYLKYKLNQNILDMKLNKKLVDLESKIKQFSGSYQNIQFRSIDNELNDCLKEAELIDIVDKTDNFKQKINFLKTMLKRNHIVM